jgi:hypothetical protein
MNVNDVNIANMGRRVILPSSFMEGPRNMHQLYQDAMGIFRARGQLHYLRTVTNNVQWPKIQREVLLDQTWSNPSRFVCASF